MREKIISEIRRIANENGGKTPGRTSFQRQTGITEGDWYGKIWFRWSDAITEAGLVPNSKAVKLVSNDVLNWYGKACKEFGRPPISVEYRSFCQNNEGCPSPDTLQRHFGGKANVIEALRERATIMDDLEILNLLPERKPSEENCESSEAASVEGWVYLLKSGHHFKIGRSDNLERRVKQISVSLPEEVNLVHAIKTDDPIGIEAYWHRRFDDLRANGEWFRLGRSEVRAFKRRKFQ